MFLDAAASDPRFNAGDMMAAISKLTQLSWFDSLTHRMILIPAARRGLQQQQGKTGVDEQPAGMGTRPVLSHTSVDVFIQRFELAS